MPGVGYLTYKNKEILYIDYREITETKEFLNIYNEAHKIIMGTVEDNNLLLLLDLRETFLNYTIIKIFFGEDAKKAENKFYKCAVFGIDESKKILLDEYNKVMNKNLTAFDSEEEALEFLID